MKAHDDLRLSMREACHVLTARPGEARGTLQFVALFLNGRRSSRTGEWPHARLLRGKMYFLRDSRPRSGPMIGGHDDTD